MQRDAQAENKPRDADVNRFICMLLGSCVGVCFCLCLCFVAKIVYPGANKILQVCDLLWKFLRPNQKNERLNRLWNIYEYG